MVALRIGNRLKTFRSNLIKKVKEYRHNRNNRKSNEEFDKDLPLNAELHHNPMISIRNIRVLNRMRARRW